MRNNNLIILRVEIWGLGHSIGMTTYAFDSLNRMVSKTDPGLLSQAYVYDLAGQRTQLTDPDGGTRGYAFDLNGRFSTLTLWNGTVGGYQYDSAGRLTTILQTGPSLSRLWTYDAVGQTVVAQRIEAGTTYGQTYFYDPAGNRQVVLDLAGSATTYLYDAKNRLTQDNTSGTNAHLYNYSYDANDNILTNSESGVLTTNTYDIANRLTTSIAGAALTTSIFDANGNKTVVNSASPVSMTYNKENQLSVYLSATASVSYTYSGDGLKRAEWNAGSPTTLIWDGQDYIQQRQ